MHTQSSGSVVYTRHSVIRNETPWLKQPDILNMCFFTNKLIPKALLEHDMLSLIILCVYIWGVKFTQCLLSSTQTLRHNEYAKGSNWTTFEPEF